MERISVFDCSVIELPTYQNRSGNMSIIENDIKFPFQIKRVFYIYDIPGGKDRGAHAHKECRQFLVAASGSFEIEIDDGCNKRSFILNRPNHGLYIPPGIWAAEKRFSSGAVCLVLTSEYFNEKDYIREYAEFISFKND